MSTVDQLSYFSRLCGRKILVLPTGSRRDHIQPDATHDAHLPLRGRPVSTSGRHLVVLHHETGAGAARVGTHPAPLLDRRAEPSSTEPIQYWTDPVLNRPVLNRSSTGPIQFFVENYANGDVLN